MTTLFRWQCSPWVWGCEPGHAGLEVHLNKQRYFFLGRGSLWFLLLACLLGLSAKHYRKKYAATLTLFLEPEPMVRTKVLGEDLEEPWCKTMCSECLHTSRSRSTKPLGLSIYYGASAERLMNKKAWAWLSTQTGMEIPVWKSLPFALVGIVLLEENCSLIIQSDRDQPLSEKEILRLGLGISKVIISSLRPPAGPHAPGLGRTGKHSSRRWSGKAGATIPLYRMLIRSFCPVK